MRTIVTTLSALTLMLALAATAGAQDRPGRQADIAPDTSFDFEDDLVEGGTLGPMGTRVDGNGRRFVHRSLVRPRVHFVPEMLKSVENL